MHLLDDLTQTSRLTCLAGNLVQNQLGLMTIRFQAFPQNSQPPLTFYYRLNVTQKQPQVVLSILHPKTRSRFHLTQLIRLTPLTRK